MKKRNWNLRIGCCITGVLVLMIIVGIFWTPYEPNAMSSADKQLATDFVKELFAPDEQFIYGMTEQSGGMPVNREALRIILSKIHGVLTYDAGEFKENIQNLNIESQQEYDHLLDYLSGFSHAANSEGLLEEIFLEDLDAYMNDDVSLASYEKKVRKKIKLYQSE